MERLRRQNLEFLPARTCGLVEQVVSLICWLEIPANVPLTSSTTSSTSLPRFSFFCDLEGARGFIRGMSSYKLYFFPFKRYFRKLMMHMLLSMSAKYCAEKKAFCSNTLGGPFIPIWHLLAIPNNTKWIHSPPPFACCDLNVRENDGNVVKLGKHWDFSFWMAFVQTSSRLQSWAKLF